jgi:oligopeptide transport system substrate-binding protein
MRTIMLGVLLFMFNSCHKIDHAIPKQEQSLRINLRKEPVSLDPRKGNDMVASQIHFMLFEGLLRLNPDMSLSLAQARAYEISPDNKRYTFHLKDTVWSDGTPVTAYDFEQAWKSMLDPAFPALDAYLLYPIKNAQMAKKGEISIDQVGISSPDAKTLVVELEHPAPHFLQVVASSVLLPVQAEMNRRQPYWSSHAQYIRSNGPFILKEWELNKGMVLEKNSFYHEAERVKLQRIFIDVMDRELAVLHMHASGYFDLVGAPLSFFPAMLLEDLEKKKLLTFFPVAGSKFLAFNTSVPPFDNTHIRRAFALAIDRKTIVEQITNLNQKRALNIIPPVFLPDDKEYFQDADIEQAKQAFQLGAKETDIKALKNITFMYVSSEINHILAQALQQMWSKALGVDVALQQVEFKTLHERSKTGDFSIGLFVWVADYGDPINIFERFVDKTNHRNYPKWDNKQYRDLINEALQASSRVQYVEKLKDLEALMIQEMPLTCLFHENYAFLIHPHVQNFAISPIGHIYFDRIYIDHSKKKEGATSKKAHSTPF